MTQVIDLRDFSETAHGMSGTTPHGELWCVGNLELLDMPLASIVGTRAVSPEGVKRTKRLASIFINEGFCVVSGLAKGVDRIAHETALEMNGSTIAVMGTPIDECYPAEHRELKEQIARRGLVISQFAPGTPVRRSNFPQRNVLMASLSSTTFVVEATIDSGTKHQVRAAVRMGKRVAFLASLVSQDYPWVREALDAGVGVIIEHSEDAIGLLRALKHQVSAPMHDTSPASQQHEFAIDVQQSSHVVVSVRGDAVLPPLPAERIPERLEGTRHFQTDLPLELSSRTHKPNFFERIWKLIFHPATKH